MQRWRRRNVGDSDRCRAGWLRHLAPRAAALAAHASLSFLLSRHPRLAAMAPITIRVTDAKQVALSSRNHACGAQLLLVVRWHFSWRTSWTTTGPSSKAAVIHVNHKLCRQMLLLARPLRHNSELRPRSRGPLDPGTRGYPSIWGLEPRALPMT